MRIANVLCKCRFGKDFDDIRRYLFELILLISSFKVFRKIIKLLIPMQVFPSEKSLNSECRRI